MDKPENPHPIPPSRVFVSGSSRLCEPGRSHRKRVNSKHSIGGIIFFFVLVAMLEFEERRSDEACKIVLSGHDSSYLSSTFQDADPANIRESHIVCYIDRGF